MTTPARRQTRQRTAVAQALAEIEEFRSAQQVHELLKEQGESVGLTTVYRTLQAMADAGEVDAIRGPEGEVAYRRCSTGHHHHLVCRTCGRTVEIDGPAVERWIGALAQEHHFRDMRHDLEVFGTCPDC